MKFSRSLQFNCVPEWSEHYVAFQALKTLTHQLEAARSTPGSEETAQKLQEQFLSQYAADIQKVVSFYKQVNETLLGKYAGLQTLVNQWNAVDEATELKSVYPRRQSLGTGPDLRLFHPQEDADMSGALPPEFPMKFDDVAKEVYLGLHDLHEFLYMNYTGFSKLSKSYEKHAGTQAEADALVQQVDRTLPMGDLTRLDSMMNEIEKAYARICCENNLDEATVYLRHLLHERIIHERASVWQDMVAAERKTHEVTVVSTAPTSAGPTKKKGINIKQIISLVICAAAYFTLYFGGFFAKDYHSRGAAVLVTSVLLWVTEPLPLFITALVVPALAVLSKVILEDPDHDNFNPKKAHYAAKAVLGSMFTSTTLLLLGGFSLSAALSKTGITKDVATAVLSRVGRRPSVVLFAVMAVTCFLCVFISNVASPVLVFTIIGPMIRTLTADHPLAKALVLGVAYAANIGGLTSAIASPQSLQVDNCLVDPKPESFDKVGFGTWFIFSIPISLISLLLVWAVLLFSYPCRTLLPESCVLKASGNSWGKKQYFVALVSAVTIGLWMSSTLMEHTVGSMGILAVFPLVMFFGSGILGKDDFNGFAWNIVTLAMGGSALGFAVQSSTFLKLIGNKLGDAVSSLGNLPVMLGFGFVILVCTTFVSHTVGAIIVLPILKELAYAKKDPVTGTSPVALFVALGGLMCSVGMGMPISGFPNMSAVSQEDATGRNFINTMDFVKTGLISSVLVYLVTVLVGYAVMSFLGFGSVLPSVAA